MNCRGGRLFRTGEYLRIVLTMFVIFRHMLAMLLGTEFKYILVSKTHDFALKSLSSLSKRSQTIYDVIKFFVGLICFCCYWKKSSCLFRSLRNDIVLFHFLSV